MKTRLSILFLLFSFFAQAQLDNHYDQAKKKWGFKDSTGKVVIPAIYDNINEFTNNTTLVSIDSTFYVINRKGKRLFKFPEHPIQSRFPDRYCFFDTHNLIVYDSIGNKILSVQADRFDRWLESQDETNTYVAKKGNLVGIFNLYGHTFLPMEYEPENYEWTFHWDGNMYFYDSTLFVLKHNGKWGIINNRGIIALPFEYDKLETVQTDPSEKNFVFAAAIKEGKRVLVNSEKKAVELDFDTCPGFFNIEQQAVLLKDNKVLFYDMEKSSLVDSFAFVPFRSNAHQGGATWEESRYMKIAYKGKHMVINNKKQVIYPFSDNPANPMHINGKVFFAVMEKGKNMFALFDSKLKQITPFNFTSISSYQDRMYGSDGEQKEFFISETGKLTPVR